MDRDIAAVVVGDVMLDSWLRGPVRRIAQEAPVPVVSVEATDEAPGGAGNTAANLVALGARVRLVGALGDDACAGRLTRALALLGVDARLVTVPGRRTPHKQRLMVGEQLIARYDEEDREPVTGAAEERIIAEIEGALPGADVVIACDYGGGVCTPAVRRALAEVPMLVVDAHAITPWRECGPAAVLPNYGEVLRLLREDGDVADRVSFLTERSAALLEGSGAGMVVTTLDGEGTLLHRPGRAPYRTYAEPAPDHMATGAGDTFTAAFALWLAGGATPEQAAQAAQAAAGVVVRRPGTATCTRQELLRALRQAQGRPDGLVQGADRLAQRLDEHRRRGQRIVFTNGCFDVLHRGHVTYLEKAARLGDVLVVAVNSDASTARLKGPGRPINSCEDRMSVLAALNYVDYVASFEEDTPERLLRMVRPDLYVKGGDYTADMLPEAPLVRAMGGEVMVLDYVSDRSTTAIIDRVRSLPPELP
ncbi:D-glycero-beta-D-manno-heptose 1-phosphate adenylyltransferase [Nonomuraea sp. LPB2021202275-12-8]|uniref:D-glycero-beta-D-manno-heptose 1-phosphate adenylyltransferase n=1 Tax=Nonomuraea sp. LPB2021202275-12-8 TaxID=3120159 RepID=UPI00300D61D6